MSLEVKKMNVLLTITDTLNLILSELEQLKLEIKNAKEIEKNTLSSDYSVTINQIFRPIDAQKSETPLMTSIAVEEQDTSIKLVGEITCIEKGSPQLFAIEDFESDYEKK